jgi:hypothetical protein
MSDDPIPAATQEDATEVFVGHRELLFSLQPAR